MGQDYPSDWDIRRKKVYKRDNYRCQNCGVCGGPKGNAELHAHHIVPKSNGGSHKLSNLQTVCSACHNAVHGDVTAPTGRSSASRNSSGQRGILWWLFAAPIGAMFWLVGATVWIIGAMIKTVYYSIGLMIWITALIAKATFYMIGALMSVLLWPLKKLGS